jgi:hypothetical protein
MGSGVCRDGKRVSLLLRTQPRSHLTNPTSNQLTAEVGSQTWYFTRANLGGYLLDAGRYQEATQVFSEILAGLGEQPSYHRCVTLTILGRCLTEQGQASQAAQLFRQGLAEAHHWNSLIM